jgi:PST family polysaccharide transporter
MSCSFLITGFKIVPMAILQRDLRYRHLALNEGIQAIVQSVGTVVLAFSGFRYWTLIIGTLVGNGLSTILACRLVPFHIKYPRLREIRPAIAVGGHIVISRVCWYAYNSADIFIAGFMLGEKAAGIYSLGMTLASMPVEKVSAVLMRVAPGIFSVIQNDKQQLRRYLLLMTEGLALITIPASIGMALVAYDFVLLVLGKTWLPAVVPLQLLSLYTAYRSVVPLFSVVLVAVGRSKFAMQQSILTAALLPVSFAAGSALWGINGIGMAWAVVYPLLTIPTFYVTFRAIDLKAWTYIASLWPALSCTAIMGCVVYAVNRHAALQSSLELRFGMEVFLGASTYTVALAIIHRRRIAGLREMLRLLRSR